MQIFVYESLCAGVLGHPGESLIREGRAMLMAIVADFQAIPDVEVVTLFAEQVAATDERARFCELASKADWTMVIAPEFDDILQQRSQDVLDAGGRLLGASPDAIGLTGDKYALAQHFKHHNVTTPRTHIADPTTIERMSCPFVLKPRHGAGSQATYLVRKPIEKKRIWRQAIAEWPENDLIIQEYFKGRAASLAVISGPGEFLVLHPAWQRISRDGRFRYLGGVVPIEGHSARLAYGMGKMVAECMDGLQGYFGIDIVLGAEADVVIEINPRLTTSYIGLRKLCQDNLAHAILRAVMGNEIGNLTWSDDIFIFDADGKVRIRSE
ncbi:MAG: ATP-grasp domain-containing protein [Gemmataceae bacterium]|nr:ATP-grasp domain-containing protein [Gemmataceae bacterium]